MTFKKKILSGLLAAAMMSSMSVTAFADRLPQPYGQNRKLWCWVSTAKMVGENNGGKGISKNPKPTSNEDGLHSFNNTEFWGLETSVNEKNEVVTVKTVDGVQEYIVEQIKGGDVNVAADSNQDTFDALELAAAEDVDVGRYGEQRKTLTFSQLADIKNEVGQGRYVIGTMRNSTYKRGHAVVIKDYRAFDDTYRVFDPWDLTDDYYESEKLFSKYAFLVDDTYYRIEFYTYCRPTN